MGEAQEKLNDSQAHAAVPTPPMTERIRDWLADSALPFWAEVGRDPRGGLHEDLTLEATAPGPSDFKRTRVQARQMYVYAAAHDMDWDGPALTVAEDAYRFLMSHARLDGGAWARRLSPDGKVIDDTVDLYDLAFVIYGMAHLYKVTDDPEPLAMARQTLEFITAHLSHPMGGFHETKPKTTSHRLQNPHMHLLEALLALYEAAGDRRVLRQATQIRDLILTEMMSRQSGHMILLERADDHWRTLTTPEGRTIEPGHHFEWTWLLAEHARLSGQDIPEHQHGLYETATTWGLNSKNGLVYDEITTQGRCVHATSRCWTVTEALRSHLIMGHQDRAEAMAERLFQYYLDPAPTGTWRDQMDANGQAICQRIPASTFYHLMTAFSAWLSLVD